MRKNAQKKRGSLLPLLAGVQGFEPQLTDPESAVLPLNDTPIFFCFLALSRAHRYNTPSIDECQELFSDLLKIGKIHLNDCH